MMSRCVLLEMELEYEQVSFYIFTNFGDTVVWIVCGEILLTYLLV